MDIAQCSSSVFPNAFIRVFTFVCPVFTHMSCQCAQWGELCRNSATLLPCSDNRPSCWRAAESHRQPRRPADGPLGQSARAQGLPVSGQISDPLQNGGRRWLEGDPCTSLMNFPSRVFILIKPRRFEPGLWLQSAEVKVSEDVIPSEDAFDVFKTGMLDVSKIEGSVSEKDRPRKKQRRFSYQSGFVCIEIWTCKDFRFTLIVLVIYVV